MEIRVSYDKVVETLCLCDVVAYIKARNGLVEFPREFRGRALEEVVARYKGVKLVAEKGGYTHVFVVRPSAARKKLAIAAAAVFPAVRPE